MAAQAEQESNKVVLDKADLPLPQEEELGEEEERGAAEAEESATERLLEHLPEDEPPSKKRKLIIIGAGALVLLLVLVWFLFLRGPAEPETMAEPETATVTAPPGLVAASPTQLALPPFLIPIAPDARGRLLRITVVLEFNSGAEKDSFMESEQDMLVTRDAIYRSLRNRSAQDISSARLNGYLTGQMREQINQALGRAAIKHLNFPEFLFAG